MNNFLHKATIPFFVFVTGGCVLIIEIVAIRILAPYFGNTIFMVSSVISAVLAALSLGYYAGGKIADKYPNEKVFYCIIATSGLFVVFLHVVGIIFLSKFGYKLPIIEGPIVSSVLLFFLQSFLLGTLSPFAVKLQQFRVQELGVGNASGQIFFWSTLGSIVGSLAAGFFLIPNFGIDKIMLGVGFLLVILGLFGMLKMNVGIKVLLATIFITLSLLLIPSFNLTWPNLVFAKDSLYQKITIYDGIYNEKPVRFFLQNRSFSSAAFLDSDELVFEYSKYYSLCRIFNKDVKETLVIGAGAYSVPKALLKSLPGAIVSVVEIDPLVFELGVKYFGLPANEPRLKNFTQDGRRFLQDSNKKYDFIFSDAYSSLYSIPEHLATKEFFELAKSKLADEGVFTANVIGSLDKRSDSFLFSEIKTFKNVFENSYFFAVDSNSTIKTQNIIFAGYNSTKIIDLNSPMIKNNDDYIISGLSTKQINLNNFDLSSYPILTDNFAPVDYLISKEFTNL